MAKAFAHQWNCGRCGFSAFSVAEMRKHQSTHKQELREICQCLDVARREWMAAQKALGKAMDVSQKRGGGVGSFVDVERAHAEAQEKYRAYKALVDKADKQKLSSPARSLPKTKKKGRRK